MLSSLHSTVIQHVFGTELGSGEDPGLFPTAGSSGVGGTRGSVFLGGNKRLREGLCAYQTKEMCLRFSWQWLCQGCCAGKLQTSADAPLRFLLAGFEL